MPFRKPFAPSKLNLPSRVALSLLASFSWALTSVAVRPRQLTLGAVRFTAPLRAFRGPWMLALKDETRPPSPARAGKVFSSPSSAASVPSSLIMTEGPFPS